MTHPNNTTEEGPRYVDALDVLFASGALKHLNKRQALVLIWIARRAHRDTRSDKFWTCWGFQEKIAHECGLAVRNVSKAQAELVEMRLIHRKRVKYGQGKRGYFYKLASEDDLFGFGENGQPARVAPMDQAARERLSKKSAPDNPIMYATGSGDQVDHRIGLSGNGQVTGSGDPVRTGSGDPVRTGSGCPPKKVVENEYKDGKVQPVKFSGPPSESNGKVNGNGAHDDDIWQRALAELQLQLPETTFETWLRDTSLIACTDDNFIIGAPHAYARDWLQNRIHGKVTRVLGQMTKRAVKVDFKVRPLM